MAEVHVLGPVEMRAAGRSLDLGPPKQRAVFVALVVDAGRPVPVATMVDRVWDEAPPAARDALYAHIRRIRRLLAHAADADGGGPRVDRGPGGYLLDIDRDQVDLHRFHRLVDQARAAEGDDGRRAALLREALGLWRGPPLAGLPGEWFARLRDGWRQHWLDAMVAWARAELRLGNHDAVIGRLHGVLVEHPLVEPLAAVMMQALYAAGRGAEALDHYAATRHRLADQLGVDPGPELRRLHEAILRGDARPPATVPATAAQANRQVPRQLPGPPQLFTGRAGELAALDEVRDASAVVISAIDGMAGVGKTALALRAAHRIADRYPDGQLFLDLHGHTPGTEPVEPVDALDYLLRALGVPGTQVPSGLAERAALYRTRLAGRRMLILLDNAATETHVQPLLPGAPGCLVLVTSRRRLAGLDHTQTLSLDILPVPDAVALVTRTVGDERTAGEPAGLVAELAELCGRLPLAIRIAAARLRSHPAWDLSHLVERLRDRRDRLIELDAGQRSVTAALDLSYQHLSPDQQHTYRLLGLHPGPEFDRYATAALLDSSPGRAGRMLDQLLDAHLLEEPVTGRYRFHDLTRAHAARTGADVETAAVDRLLDHYRHTAALAMDAGYPFEREHRPQIPPVHTPYPDLSDPATALAWLDTELPNLMSATAYAAGHDRPEHVLHLAAILHRHLRSRGHQDDAATLHRRALATARATGHRAGELAALIGLGHVHRQLDRYDEAIEHFERALHLARDIGHRAGELDVLNGLGRVHWMQGRYGPATETFGRAQRIARDIGHRAGELDALIGLGHIHWMRGELARAADNYQQVLRIARAAGHRHGELVAMNGLGDIHRQLGRQAQAVDQYRPALRIARAAGDRVGQLLALSGLADAYRRQRRYRQAGEQYQQILDIARESSDRNYEYEARQGLGRLRYATGNPAAAIAHHDNALALADELGQPVDQARAHDGLARAHDALHHHDVARKHWQEALTILTGLGIDHTDEEETTAATIRAHLARLSLQAQPRAISTPE
jgi:DNA-binding SARP family transcriptional activator/tetratricopeptide (TPR) repeat protein